MSERTEALLMSLPHAVDMALGSPEIGAVNFNLLNAILQVFIHEMKLQDRCLQIRGPDNERIQALLQTAHPALSVRVTDYDITYNPWSNYRTREPRQSSDLRIFGFKDDRKPKPSTPPPPEAPEKTWKIIVVDSSKDADGAETTDSVSHTHGLVPISDERFVQLESAMKVLTEKMNEILELPKDSKIVKAMRSIGDKDSGHASIFTPAGEMWRTLKTTNRVDAIEAGFNKLATTLDVFMNEVTEALNASPTYYSNLQTEEVFTNDSLDAEPQNAETNDRCSRASIFVNVVQRLDAIEKQFENLQLEVRASQVNLVPSAAPPSKDLNSPKEQLQDQKKLIDSLEQLVMDAWVRLDELEFCEQLQFDLATANTKINELESSEEALLAEMNNKLTAYFDNINMHVSRQDKYVDSVQNHMLLIEEELSLVLNRINALFRPEKELEGMSVAKLFKKVIHLQDSVKKVLSISHQIIKEHCKRKLATEALMEQIDFMKILKADKEDVEEALDVKADAHKVNEALNRKVSHDQFEKVQEEIAETFDETTTNINEQGTMWYESLAQLQTDIDKKLEKIDELEPLRRSVNERINSVQKQIRSFINMRREEEAAAAKKNLLRDVECIACDNPVFMKKENVHSLFPTPQVVSGKPSIRPQLAYKMDAVRKSKTGGIHEQNNNLPQNVTTRREGLKSNRYCGGSHTITTAQQRLAHDGHFIQQWGSKMIPQKESLMVGTDNKVYKSRRSVCVTKIPHINKNIQTSGSYNTLPYIRKAKTTSVQEKTTLKHSQQLRNKLSGLKSEKEKLVAKVNLNGTKDKEETRKTTNEELTTKLPVAPTSIVDSNVNSYLKEKAKEKETHRTDLKTQKEPRNPCLIQAQRKFVSSDTGSLPDVRPTETVSRKLSDSTASLFTMSPKKRVVFKESLLRTTDMPQLRSKSTTPEPLKPVLPLKSNLKTAKHETGDVFEVLPSSSAKDKSVRFAQGIAGHYSDLGNYKRYEVG